MEKLSFVNHPGWVLNNVKAEMEFLVQESYRSDSFKFVLEKYQILFAL